MAANKKKKEVKVRDLKPSKDAKGGQGAGRNLANRNLSSSSLQSATRNQATNKLNY